MKNKQLINLMEKCSQVRLTTGTVEKKKLLSAFKEDMDFLSLLKFLLDPKITTGIKRAKLCKPLESDFDLAVNSDFFWLLNYVSSHNTGTDENISACKRWIEDFATTDSERKFCEAVISKSLKLGVNVKTVNHVYGNEFIYSHEVQQGCSREHLRLKKGETFFLSQKMNGIRATYFCGKLISRQGFELTGFDHILRTIEKIKALGFPDYVFDGELIRRNYDQVSDNENFRLTAGIVNGDGDKSEIGFVLFDLLPEDEFVKRQSTSKYSERRKQLLHIKEYLMGIRNDDVSVVPMVYCGNDQTVIDEFLKEEDTAGHEGLMLNKDVPYFCKRHSGLIKIKTFHFSDLQVIRCEEGDGRLSGTLGALVVDYKGNEVGVGSGFTDEQRRACWANRDRLPGSIVEVKYKEVSKDKKTGLESIQFPVFVRIREDKTSPSLE